MESVVNLVTRRFDEFVGRHPNDKLPPTSIDDVISFVKTAHISDVEDFVVLIASEFDQRFDAALKGRPV